ncbi:MAG TPA: hypothetical protein VF175_16830 [Lacipirellula sp.]
MRAAHLLLISAAGAALAGCSNGPFPYPVQATTVYPGYGDAIQHNAAVQIIDPAPANAANTELAFDGHRAALAIGRYWTDQVKPPHELRTSDVGDGGGGG